MGGSGELGWENSSFRELDTCAISSGSLGVLASNNRLGSSRDASNNTVCIQTKEKPQKLSGTDNFDNQIGSSADAQVVGGLEPGDISLRQWLDKPERSVDFLECLHIFRQIVETVNDAHSQGIVVHNVRPSCFIMSSFNRISFIESASCSSSGSDSFEDGEKGTGVSRNSTDCTINHGSRVNDRSSSSPFLRNLPQQGSRSDSEESQQEISPMGTFERASEASGRHTRVGGTRGFDEPAASCLRSDSVYATHPASIEERERTEVHYSSKAKEVEENKKAFPLKQILDMELNWYTSPEEAAGAASSFSSDIYRLGVLLFELFCTFSSAEEKLRTMSNLRHRVLPPQLLLKWPKEASFCLWLLHPQPNSRPKMSEVLQSEFLNEPRDSLEQREAAIKLREEIEEKELLLEFLLQVQQKKQETANKLHDTICCLSSDIEEVLKQQSLLKKSGSSYLDLKKDENLAVAKPEEPLQYPVREQDPSLLCSRKRFKPGLRIPSGEEFNNDLFKRSENLRDNQEIITSKSSRLMRNFKKLESAYFSTRCRPIKPTEKPVNRNFSAGSTGRGSTVRTEGSNLSSVDNLASKEVQSEGRTGWINPFLEGLCKYLSFSKLKVRADLKQGDLLNSSNLVCSLSFDRDKEFFATAGVNKKIKVFECDMILNEDLDIHYPVIEMASRSKLSSICWNSYIKSQIASSDFEGVVQVWDVTRSQVFVELREHERRVWSVDFSQADPTRLSSGSDDGTVKLWNINQAGSTGTIKTKANVCCVQFPPDSSRSLAIGSADHMIYCYDLRNTRIPWCTLMSHNKTVSYIKFIDSSTLVSASTDNSLMLWDLSMNTSRALDSPVQTFTGHTNLKNFVGLSIADGYIATGSETNEVFVYHKAFPMPVLSYKFNSTDPLSGQEVDDSSQFISCVSWRGQSSTLVAANSTGNIKILEMV